ARDRRGGRALRSTVARCRARSRAAPGRVVRKGLQTAVYGDADIGEGPGHADPAGARCPRQTGDGCPCRRPHLEGIVLSRPIVVSPFDIEGRMANLARYPSGRRGWCAAVGAVSHAGIMTSSIIVEIAQ